MCSTPSVPPVPLAVARLRAAVTSKMGSAGTAAQRFVALVEAGALDLPRPAEGATAERWWALAELGAVDLAVTRLAEGHVDALAILAEAGANAVPEAPYGVWAAEPPGTGVTATPLPGDGGWRLDGTKRYASGAGTLVRALVTATAPDGARLFDVDASAAGVRPLPGTWAAVGMAETDSVDVAFDGVVVAAEAAVGASGFYTARPGFWHGAVGVAACWYGGALGVAREVRRRCLAGADDHSLAHFGAITATCSVLCDALAAAAAAIDADPTDASGQARRRALVVRHAVEQGCQEVMIRAGRATGTAPLVFDAVHARRVADLGVYVRQHHAERDLRELGALELETRRCP